MVENDPKLTLHIFFQMGYEQIHQLVAMGRLLSLPRDGLMEPKWPMAALAFRWWRTPPKTSSAENPGCAPNTLFRRYGWPLKHVENTLSEGSWSTRESDERCLGTKTPSALTQDLFGVRRGTEKSEIRKLFRKRVQTEHPVPSLTRIQVSLPVIPPEVNGVFCYVFGVQIAPHVWCLEA